MFRKYTCGSALFFFGAAAACHKAPEAGGVPGGSSVQESQPAVRLFAIAKCVSSDAEIGADRKTLTLTASTVNGKLATVTGDYFSASENESAEAGLEGSILMIAKGADGEYLISLRDGAFFFSDESEGGERTVPTQLITLNTATNRVDTGSSLGDFGVCTFSNLSLLEKFVHDD